MNKINIIMPAGAVGANANDTFLDTFLREFAKKHGDPREWPEKYGTDYRDDNVVMHECCNGIHDECPYCATEDMPVTDDLINVYGVDRNNDNAAPNFWYKPLDFKVWWYKCIGRSVKINKTLTADEFQAMQKACLG